MDQHAVPSSVANYAAKLKTQFFLAGLEARIAVQEAIAGAKLSSSFRMRFKEEIEGLFLEARADTESSRQLQNMLKDAQALWLTCIDSILPQSEESTPEYESRLAGMQFEIERIANRMCLGV